MALTLARISGHHCSDFFAALGGPLLIGIHQAMCEYANVCVEVYDDGSGNFQFDRLEKTDWPTTLGIIRDVLIDTKPHRMAAKIDRRIACESK